MSLPDHGNKCIVCGTSEEIALNPNSSSWCRNCNGHPVMCNAGGCGYGAYIMKENPKIVPAYCPSCDSHVVAVQAKDGWC